MREYYTYKSVYCALCKQLGKDYGVFSRMILNYDCTFFALFGFALSEDKPVISHGRCCCNPLKRCDYCSNNMGTLSQASALSVISMYYKVKDNLVDKGALAKLKSFLVYPFAAHWHRKASKKYPQIEDMVSEMLSAQLTAEKDLNCKIDKAAEPSAQMFSKAMMLFAKNDTDRLIYSQFGYFFGKWVYLMDAIDDYEKDLKAKNFNPLLTSGMLNGKKENERNKYLNEVLNQYTAQAKSAYDLIKPERFNGILDNVINYGLPMMQKKILFDKRVDTNV